MVRCTIVETGSAAAAALKNCLSQVGVAVNSVQSLKDALVGQRRSDGHVMLVPEGEVCSLLLDHRRRLTQAERAALIVYSTDADVEAMNEAICNGADEFVVAPFDGELLQFKIMQMMALGQRGERIVNR
jgi:DNA-binding NtrC family response regulator